jgi:phosphoenolpyruvate carboxylase
MATQHPDNACAPWWKADRQPFIATADEIDELLVLFKEMAIDEYMWDWEGKYVDESVGEKLFGRAREFFLERPLGEDLHLTYRIPALADGKMHRLARAFMNVLAIADLARDIGLPRPPVTEMFLPLTTSPDQPLAVRKAFREIADYHRAVFHQSQADENALLSMIEVTPLVEDVGSLRRLDEIVEPYWESLVKEGKDCSERGQRVFLARSDPALNAGLVPAVLGVKVALALCAELSEKHGFPVHPVIGTGSLPFRGGVSPRTTGRILDQYAGARTYSIQSAYRYDYPKDEVDAGLAALKKQAPTLTAERFSAKEKSMIGDICEAFEAAWKPTIEAIAPVINDVAAHVPPRRERLQHIGLFGYSRGVGAVRLPRAIGFTAALYSLGIPPELIATGRCLKKASKEERTLIEKTYPALKDDLADAGAYLNRENLELLAHRHEAFQDVREDVMAIEKLLGIELKPESPDQVIHRNLTSNVFHRLERHEDKEALKSDVLQAAVLRRSIG